MEYHIKIPGIKKLLSKVQDKLLSEDPGLIADISEHEEKLRISTVLSDWEVLALIGQIGVMVDEGSLIQTPSICCGGCSG